ncbi:MAG TPA: response regulator, partial [Terriglobales bacterium]
MNSTREIEILVVDDDRELAETLREFLIAEGYAVGIANSAASALEFYQQHPQIALALLDVVMPQSNGIAL